MNILKPTFAIWPQPAGLQGIYQQIEKAGRVCYKSENHLTATSAKPFVERLIASQHTAMLEHATVYLVLPADFSEFDYRHNKFTWVNVADGKQFVTTNFRVIVENNLQQHLQYLSEPTEHHEKRVTVHFTTQIAISREFNRHRVNSMAEQSTRYCNYGKAKFGEEISINLPTWVAEQEQYNDEVAHQTSLKQLCAEVANGESDNWDAVTTWLFANLSAEAAYMQLIGKGLKPQQARVVLPLDTCTELVHTAFIHDWKHFFDLRALGTTGAPHPDAKVLAQPLYEAFKEKGWLK